MGAINNAFNQAVGAMAGAALAAKHAQESEFSKMNAADNSALVARNQSREADAVANEALNEANDSELFVDLSNAETDEEEAKKAFNREKKGSRKWHKKMKDLVEAQEALKELKVKYKALRDLQDRAIEQRRYADKATKMALDQKTKYEKRWGGIK